MKTLPAADVDEDDDADDGELVVSGGVVLDLGSLKLVKMACGVSEEWPAPLFDGD